jgi:hypothetical protein
MGMALAISLGVCKAEDEAAIRKTLLSFYGVPYDSATEMTDVTLVAEYYTNQSDILQLANRVAQMYTNAASRTNWNSILKEVFANSLPTKAVSTTLYRERVTASYYRLDFDPTLKSFTNFAWEDGRFTNKHVMPMVYVSNPPKDTNDEWTRFTVQPIANAVTVRSGKRPLVFNEQFYFSIFDLPDLIKFNVLMQTMDLEDAKKHSHDILNDLHSPAAWQFFKPDEKRLAGVLDGHGPAGRWTLTSLSQLTGGPKELSLISSDGIDHDYVKVIFNESHPQQRYIAYMRDPKSGSIIALSAWDYDEIGDPVRFIKIERKVGASNLRAWAQNIVHAERSTNVNWALFNIDIKHFASVLDERPTNPIATLNGKVIFDAARDPYRKLSGVSAWNLAGKHVIIARCVILCIFCLPLAFAAMMYLRTRSSRGKMK